MTEVILLVALFVATFLGWCVMTYHIEMINKRVDDQEDRVNTYTSNIQWRLDEFVKRIRKCELLVTEEVDEEASEAVREASAIVHDLQEDLKEIQSL